MEDGGDPAATAAVDTNGELADWQGEGALAPQSHTATVCAVVVGQPTMWGPPRLVLMAGNLLMTRTLISLLVSFAALLGCSGTSPEQPTEPPPNFIVIFADDLGYGDLSSYGSERIRTPRLDQMAAEGIRFTDFYAAAPFCSPSRASILTGRYPVRAGVPNVLFPTEKTGLDPEEVTIAEMLAPAGYVSAAIGKWHLGYPEPFRGQNQGFEFFFGLPYSNDMYKQPEGEEPRAQLPPWEIPLLDNDEIVEAPPVQETLTQRYTARALDFIRANRERPFFLYFPHTFPHNPVYASEDFAGRSGHGLYTDSVEEIDWSTGEILDLLDELEIAERTLVMFTSDNGPTRNRPVARWGENAGSGDAGPLRGNKGNTWEGGMRVPAIFRQPGAIPAERETGEVASILDLLPTFAEMAGAEPPADRVIDGRSIAGLLRGDTDNLEERPFFYYFGHQLQALRVGRWKLILQIDEYPEEPTSLWYAMLDGLFERHYRLKAKPELYDLEADIGETTDVAAEHPEVVERLTAIADEFDTAMQADKRVLPMLGD